MKKNLKAAVISILALSTIIALSSCSKKTQSENSARIINVAHTNYYVPYDFIDENGNSDGFEVAVLKEIDALLPQYEFKFHGVSDDELLIGIETGKYQVGTKAHGLQKNEKRNS